MNNKSFQALTVAVPAYGRPNDVRQLLAAIAGMSVVPGEVLICEDRSPERLQIAAVVDAFRGSFASLGISLVLHENPENLGYDRNVRSLFQHASREWVMIMGDDDLVLPATCVTLENAIASMRGVDFFARAFLRFSDRLDKPLGVSTLSPEDVVFSAGNSRPRMIFRLAGFVGGLVVRRAWALENQSSEYDGTLYYQIHLAGLAYCQNGIGYISTPLVGGRTGNPPLFGGASTESAAHIPGSYRPAARAAMWRGVLKIAGDLERRFRKPIVQDIRRELTVQQAFHVFEMTARQSRRATWQLGRELKRLGLMGHWLPRAYFMLNLIFGRAAVGAYAAARYAMQGGWRVRRQLQTGEI